MNFFLLFDFNKEIVVVYGVLYEEFVLGMKGVVKCLVFVIDGEGVVCYVEVLDNVGELFNFEVVKEILFSLN